MRFHRLCGTFIAAFVTVTPYTPLQFLSMAKERVAVSEKITILRRLVKSFPLDPTAQAARDHLISLLTDSNRTAEALQEYRDKIAQSRTSEETDFKLIELLLKNGAYGDVLRQTAAAPRNVRDYVRDQRLMEARVQALLAQGQYRVARHAVQQWLKTYEGDGVVGGRFEGDVKSIQYLRRHLLALERLHGPRGKAMFTAAVPDSLKQWGRRQHVPIVFFKLIPAHPTGQIYEPVMPGRHDGFDYFSSQVSELNRGFQHLSGGLFSLFFQGVHTLYVKEGDVDPGHLLTSRVYVHTLPPLYRSAGEAFVVLVDYRQQAKNEAAYMGDGLIHIAANKLQTMVLMHEILHGLGATHQEWAYLEGQGYRFDDDDRGLMTFEKGELVNLGLEEKNRAVLGWPHVATLRLPADTNLAVLPNAPRSLPSAAVGRIPFDSAL